MAGIEEVLWLALPEQSLPACSGTAGVAIVDSLAIAILATCNSRARPRGDYSLNHSLRIGAIASAQIS